MNKSRNYLIASHGALASGIKSSIDIIVGGIDNIFLLEAYLSENRSIEDDVNAVLKKVKDEDELIIFTDLLGGSVTNQLAKLSLRNNTHLISGFNLPLIIEVLLADTETPVAEVIRIAIENAKKQIVYVNQLMNSSIDNSNND